MAVNLNTQLSGEPLDEQARARLFNRNRDRCHLRHYDLCGNQILIEWQTSIPTGA